MKNVTFSKRDTNIVKGLAICAMVFHHLFLSEDRFTPYNISTAPFTSRRLMLIALAGKVCVAAFTFLSAYGMTLSYKSRYSDFEYTKKETVPIVWKRLVNLLIGYWCCYITVFIIAYLVPCVSRPLSRYFADTEPVMGCLNMLIDFLGLSTLFGTPAISGTWWYMTLAIELICLMPLLLKLYRICGIVLFPIAIMFVEIFELNPGKNLARYLPVIVLGIWFADTNALARIKGSLSGRKKTVAILVNFVSLAGLSLFMSLNYKTLPGIMLLTDSLQAILFVLFTYLVLSEIKGISDILYFLGIHSLNIFLIHSMFRERFWAGHVYRTGHFALTFLLLLGETLAVSVVLEFVKKCLHIRKLTAWLQKAPFKTREVEAKESEEKESETKEKE